MSSNPSPSSSNSEVEVPDTGSQEDNYLDYLNEPAEGTSEETETEETESDESETSELPEEAEEEETEETPEGEITDEDKGEVEEKDAAFKDVKAKYPNLFKDFPALRGQFFRAQEFGKLFPSVEIAKDAAGKASALDQFEETLIAGDPSLLLNSLAQVNQQSVEKLAKNFLPAVYQGSPKLFAEITTPLFENLVRELHEEGTKTANKNLVAVAQHLGVYLFKDPTPPKQREVAKQDPERVKFEQEKREFEGNKVFEFQQDTANECRKALISTLNKGLDPNNVLPAFTKKALIREIEEEVARNLSSDDNHINSMTQLFAHARKAGLSGDAKARITNAYLARVKAVLPPIRQRLLKEALGKQANTGVQNKRHISGTAKVGSGQRTSSNAVDWNKTSYEDFLNGKPKLKK